MQYRLLVCLVLRRLCNQLCSSGVVPGVGCVWSIDIESFPCIQFAYRSGWKSFTKGSMDILTMSLLQVHYRGEKKGWLCYLLCSHSQCSLQKWKPHSFKQYCGKVYLRSHFSIVYPAHGGKICWFGTVETMIEPSMVTIRKCNDELSSFLSNLWMERDKWGSDCHRRILFIYLILFLKGFNQSLLEMKTYI